METRAQRRSSPWRRRYSTERPEVARVARTVLGSQAAEVDDVVQDALVSLVKALG